MGIHYLSMEASVSKTGEIGQPVARWPRGTDLIRLE